MGSSEGETASPLRRVPIQRRSRERVERMLTVATELIVERGSDALRMSDVAEGAGVSIGSLYQFFPDKAAIIQTLAERYNAEGLACVAAELAPVQSDAELQAALFRVTDGYYEMFLAFPAMRDIWRATQADRGLQEIDAADTAAHAGLLCDVLVRLHPEQERAALSPLAMLTMQLIATAVRLAISVERSEGDAVIAAFKRMLPERLAGVV